MEPVLILFAAGIFVLLALVFIITLWATRVRIGKDEVGIVSKKFILNPFQAALPSHQQIALQGETGVQADTLSAGQYWGYGSWQYTIDRVPLIQVPAGKIGLVVAKDGASIPPGRQLGRVVDCHDFQDAHAFLTNGGQRGQQMGILTAGEYRINTALFDVVTSSNIDTYNGKLKAEDLRVYTVNRDKIGIVTTFDGAPLPANEIAASIISGHDNFQNGQNFIDAGGHKGLQEEILSASAYNLNPWFVKVKQVPLLRIPVGTVGVVTSYSGKTPENLASNDLVERGYKGICKTPLYPGRYPINSEVMSVVIVPTNPIALDWNNKKKPLYNYDAKLRALRLRSKDGFLFEIEVTQIIRITAQKAPEMILSIGSREAEATESIISQNSDSADKRYPSIRNLVTKELEPTIGSHFRSSAQDHEALDFHHQRIERQREAKHFINNALKRHGVEGRGTLINEIDLPDELEKILKEQKIFEKKQEKEKERQDLALYQARHEVNLSRIKAEGQAKEIRIKGEAEAYVIEQKGDAETKVIKGRINALTLEGYLGQKDIEQLVKIKLPNTMLGQSGWLEPVMARMLGDGRNQKTSSEDNPDWLEKLMDLLNNNPTIIRGLKSFFNDSHNPTRSPEIVTSSGRELPSDSEADRATDTEIIISEPEQE